MDVFERIKDIAEEWINEGGVIGDMASKDAGILEALKNIIKEAARCIQDIADGHDLGNRAHGYCVAQLLTACDNDHSYLGGGTFTVQDLADDILKVKEDDPEPATPCETCQGIPSECRPCGCPEVEHDPRREGIYIPPVGGQPGRTIYGDFAPGPEPEDHVKDKG